MIGLVLSVLVAAGKGAALEVDGGLPLADVAAVLQLHASETSACFAPDGGAPRKAERVRVWWNVNEPGRVDAYGFVDGRYKDSQVVPCLVTGVQSWWWPGSLDGGTWIRHEFQPGATPAPGDEATALSPEQLAPVVEAQLGSMAECVTTAWPADAPKLTGCFRLGLVVGPAGAVIDAHPDVPGNLEATAIPACVTASARTWRFPASADGGVTRWTTAWVVAPTEQDAKLLFKPDEPAFALVPVEAPRKPAGGLEKSVISGVIKAAEPQIRFCYERELQELPGLGGKLSVAWTIGPSGSVVSAEVKESTVQNAALEACVLARVRRMQFPPPVGGGVVNVTFPWIFKHAGED